MEMTAKYIEREAAVNALAEIINESDMPGDWNKGMSAAMSALFRIPAADAIEELSREVEEHKVAYRKEHNKRLAENRYLYDELTKAVREKLLMTPMRIEMSEPPKEET